MRKVLIVGATSAIAEATARQFATAHDRLYLVARDAQRLQALACDLRIRGAAQVECRPMDALDYARHKTLFGEAAESLGGLDTALIAHGTLPDQKRCEASYDETLRELDINCLSVISLLTHLAEQFESQRHGTLAVISSPAGDRGRQSNYVYGTAKAAVSTFAQGLRNRLHRCGVHVLTIKPGFVDTPMTADFDKGFMWAQPETVARSIYKAVQSHRDVVYLPWRWYLIMLVIKNIPERIFKRLSL